MSFRDQDIGTAYGERSGSSSISLRTTPSESTSGARLTSPRAPGVAWVKCWCPPKPLIGLQPIERMLNRHTFTRCPESRLAVAVITLAIGDCLSRDRHRERREARRFILGAGLDEWCDRVALNPEFVRLVAKKAGYLADEQLYWRYVAKKASRAKKHLDQNSPASGQQGDTQ